MNIGTLSPREIVLVAGSEEHEWEDIEFIISIEGSHPPPTAWIEVQAPGMLGMFKDGIGDAYDTAVYATTLYDRVRDEPVRGLSSMHPTR